MLELLSFFDRRDVFQFFEILVDIFIVLFYNHICAILYLIRSLYLQLGSNRSFDFLPVQWLWPYILLEAVPINLTSDAGPHLSIVAGILLLELPIDDHEDLQDAHDQPVADRLL